MLQPLVVKLALLAVVAGCLVADLTYADDPSKLFFSSLVVTSRVLNQSSDYFIFPSYLSTFRWQGESTMLLQPHIHTRRFGDAVIWCTRGNFFCTLWAGVEVREGLGGRRVVRRDRGLDLPASRHHSLCHHPLVVLASVRLGSHVRRTRGCHGRLIYRTPL